MTVGVRLHSGRKVSFVLRRFFAHLPSVVQDDLTMRTRSIDPSIRVSLTKRVSHDGLIRSAVFLGVAQRTLSKALRGEPVAIAIAARLESSAT